jgi:glycosyltransferase involved in cell wall biosynthesis
MIEGPRGENPPEGPGGFVVDILDDAAVADAVTRLLNDDALRETYGQNLKRRVRGAYASDLSADRYRALYARAPSIEAA